MLFNLQKKSKIFFETEMNMTFETFNLAVYYFGEDKSFKFSSVGHGAISVNQDACFFMWIHFDGVATYLVS